MNKKKKVWLNVAIFAAAVMLGLWYILILWYGKHPDVGIEYRMYYITHELSDWPGYGNLSYRTGTKEICTSLKDRKGKKVDYKVCQRKGQGWIKQQYDGSVNSNTTSYIYYIPENDEKNSIYEIEINDFKVVNMEAGESSVKVLVNGKEIGTFSDKGSYNFDMNEIQANELLTICFVADNCSFSLWSTTIK